MVERRRGVKGGEVGRHRKPVAAPTWRRLAASLTAVAIVLAGSIVAATVTSPPAAAAQEPGLPAPGQMPGWRCLVDWPESPCPAGTGPATGVPLYTDDDVSTWVGGNFTIQGMAAEVEGRTIVAGDMTVAKTATYWRGLNLGVAGIGSQIAPPPGSVMLGVGGDLQLVVPVGQETQQSQYTINVGQQIGGKVAVAGTSTMLLGTSPGHSLTGAFSNATLLDRQQSLAYLQQYNGLGAKVTELSDELAARTGAGAARVEPRGGLQTLVLTAGTANPDGLYVFEATAAQLAAVTRIDFDGLTRRADGSYPVAVINVPDGGQISSVIKEIWVDGTKITGDKYWSPDLGNVSVALMWNFPQAQKVSIQSAQVSSGTYADGLNFLGSILIPRGDLYTNVISTNGRLYVGGSYVMDDTGPDNSTFAHAEHHNYPWTFALPAVPATGEVAVSKQLTPATGELLADAGFDPQTVELYAHGSLVCTEPGGSPAVAHPWSVSVRGPPAEIDGLPLGATCTVTEEPGLTTANGAQVTVPDTAWAQPQITVVGASGSSVVVTEGSTQVTVTNSLETTGVTPPQVRPRGFRISKVVGGNAAAQATTTSFTAGWAVRDAATGTFVPQTPDLTLHAGTTTAELTTWVDAAGTSHPLMQGDVVRVTETRPADATGVTWGGAQFAVGGTALTCDPAPAPTPWACGTFTLDGPGTDPIAVTLTNTARTPGVGLALKKTLPADSTFDSLRSSRFCFEVTYGNTVGTLAIPANGTPVTVTDGTTLVTGYSDYPVAGPVRTTLNGLTAGSAIAIREVLEYDRRCEPMSPPQAPNGQWATPILQVDGKPVALVSNLWTLDVAASGIVDVEVLNSIPAQFRVAKRVAGESAGLVDTVKPFTFRYEITDGPSKGAAGTLEVALWGTVPMSGIARVGDTIALTEIALPQFAGVQWGTPTFQPASSITITTANMYNVDFVVTNLAQTPKPAAFDIPIQKVGPVEHGSVAPLGGAEFRLLADNGGAAGDPVPGRSVAPVAGTTGKFVVEDLSPGTYWLLETRAPSGYTLLASAVRFTVSPTGVITIANPGDNPQVVAISTTGSTVRDAIQVTNLPSHALPFAGGGGGPPPAAIGIAALLAAGLLTVAIRRPRARCR
ncbi:choice-of-anchor A family protein [Xylanimonas sp. McL0601]|uniref:choice-of-anchor A family protein n=1 Tax=Xylanimonas sp. McL0601 TaxID=3414739 RepID=UPI003CFA0FE4